MLVLLILHSNTQEERIFSMVCKNKTAFRPNLDPKGTLSIYLYIYISIYLYIYISIYLYIYISIYLYI